MILQKVSETLSSEVEEGTLQLLSNLLERRGDGVHNRWDATSRERTINKFEPDLVHQTIKILSFANM